MIDINEKMDITKFNLNFLKTNLVNISDQKINQFLNWYLPQMGIDEAHDFDLFLIGAVNEFPRNRKPQDVLQEKYLHVVNTLINYSDRTQFYGSLIGLIRYSLKIPNLNLLDNILEKSKILNSEKFSGINLVINYDNFLLQGYNLHKNITQNIVKDEKLLKTLYQEELVNILLKHNVPSDKIMIEEISEIVEAKKLNQTIQNNHSSIKIKVL